MKKFGTLLAGLTVVVSLIIVGYYLQPFQELGDSDSVIGPESVNAEVALAEGTQIGKKHRVAAVVHFHEDGTFMVVCGSGHSACGEEVSGPPVGAEKMRTLEYYKGSCTVCDPVTGECYSC